MSKLVSLTQGRHAIVDDDDYEYVIQHKWYVMRVRRHERVQAWIDGKGIYLHNFILGAKNVDHINGNCLDNRRSNLRMATNQQNSFNRTKSKGKSSRFKGVSWTPGKTSKVWRAYIRHNYKLIHIGYFSTEEEAALAYNERAKMLFGEFAKGNNVT